MTDCQRKTILGRPACRFEGRYDLGPSCFIWGRHSYAQGREGVDLAEKYRRETYIRDVCTRCGKTIERQREAS